MAIIIEEEKKTSGILNVLGWIVIVGMICGGLYYIFLASPNVVVVLPSASLKDIAPISQANLNAQSIVTSAKFQALKEYIVPSSTFGSVPVGRANPFVSP